MDDELQAAIDALTDAHRAEVDTLATFEAARARSADAERAMVAARRAHDDAAAAFHRLIARRAGDGGGAADIALEMCACGHPRDAHKGVSVAESLEPIGWCCVADESACPCAKPVYTTAS